MPEDHQPDLTGSGVCTVIVSYNAEPWIERCLESLRRSSLGHDVLVVDNASSDATCEIVAARFPEVHLHRMSENVGFGRGNNVGIRLALERGARYVFLFNQDAYVLEDSIAAMKAVMDRHPELGVLSPLHCSPDEQHLDRKTLRGFLNPHFPAYLSDACCGREVQDVYIGEGVNAAAWFVRGDVFRRYGGFDPLFFMYGEDDDLLYRWRFHEVKFGLAPAIRIVHLRQSVASMRTGVLHEIRIRAARRFSRVLFRMKQPGFSIAHSLAVLVGEGFLEPLALLVVRRNAIEFAGQLWAAARLLRMFPTIRRHQHLTARIGEHFLFNERR